MEGYIRLYSDQIGAYPFDEFSVVSSPLPTGFGMPTLTYLGIDVLRLPFIKATSLGHEVLHNWWGNGVYVDYERGNWCEGLTTFMADYYYKERESAQAARAMRLDWLRDFAAVAPGQDFPLREFTARSHGTSQIVGYHKAAYVFLMLRDLLGTHSFDAGLRRFWRDHRFRRASWDDLRRAFEQQSGRSLSAFFAQWLDRAGAPELKITAAHARSDARGSQVELGIDANATSLRLAGAHQRGGCIRRSNRAGDHRHACARRYRSTHRCGPRALRSIPSCACSAGSIRASCRPSCVRSCSTRAPRWCWPRRTPPCATPPAGSQHACSMPRRSRRHASRRCW